MNVIITVLVCVFLLPAGYKSSGQISSVKHVTTTNRWKQKIDSLEEAMEQKTQFKIQTSYTSRVAYAGRSFGYQQQGMAVGATYQHKSGLGFECGGYYWSKMPTRYSMTELGLYYEKTVSNNFYVSTGYWHTFFTNGDQQERNLFTNYFLADAGWYSKLGDLDFTYYYIAGNENAHRLDVNFSKQFSLYKKLGADKISFDPAVIVTFATVNYFMFLSGLEETEAENLSAFKPGNYELVIPVTYQLLGKLELQVAWHRAMPVNTLPEEHLSPFFYFSFELVKIF